MHNGKKGGEEGAELGLSGTEDATDSASCRPAEASDDGGGAGRGTLHVVEVVDVPGAMIGSAGGVQIWSERSA